MIVLDVESLRCKAKDDDLSEDDMSECVKEELVEGEAGESAEGPKKTMAGKKKKSSKGVLARKRKKGGLRLEEGTETREEGATEVLQEGQEEDPCSGERKGVKVEDKKKADDLWASFLSDVGQKVKPAPTVTAAASAPPAHGQQADGDSQGSSSQASAETKEPAQSKAPSKITITKVFDFAGEEVRVTEEVDADSKEAKSFLKSKEMEDSDGGPTRPTAPALTPGPSVKRPVGMSSILNRIGGKKQKMSTLEKSRLDWDTFKSEEGISDELAIHNRGKEGYVERKAFLERVDQRQFEREKTVRLGNMKR
ncbi:craniofacial development protein 1 isoform X2 [Amia ocellicauda]|uniref:craniofacial development protein 1 isoform X2 n=1 Tax=Amia ocellicauda TaxID=2972642 RepID=UPI003464B0D5